MTKQVTLTDLTPLFNEGEAMGCQIDGRTFYPGLPLHLKGAVQKPDGGLTGFIRFLEFVKKETEAQKEIEKIVAERGCEYLKSEKESEIRAADGIKVFLVHVLETVPKEPEIDVDFPPDAAQARPRQVRLTRRVYRGEALDLHLHISSRHAAQGILETIYPVHVQRSFQDPY